MAYDNQIQYTGDNTSPSVGGSAQSDVSPAFTEAYALLSQGNTNSLDSRSGQSSGRGTQGFNFGDKGNGQNDQNQSLDLSGDIYSAAGAATALNALCAAAAKAGDSKDSEKGDDADKGDGDEKSLLELNSELLKGFDGWQTGGDGLGLDVEGLFDQFGEEGDDSEENGCQGDNPEDSKCDEAIDQLTASAESDVAAKIGQILAGNPFGGPDLGSLLAGLNAAYGHAVSEHNFIQAGQVSQEIGLAQNALSMQSVAQQMQAMAIAMGADQSQLGNYFGGLSSGETIQSAIRQFNPQVSGNA